MRIINSTYFFLQQDVPVSTAAERYLLLYMIGVLLIVTSLVIIFFVVFQKRKNKLLIEKFEQQKAFDEELIKTQQEIQDETLKHVGRELHDNIGQLLALSSMQMNSAIKAVDEKAKSKVESAAETLKETLSQVRALSKSLNSDVISNIGFNATVSNEIERLNKTGFLEAELNITGEPVSFENKKDEIILFRILQEFFSNTLKYAEAEHLSVVLNYLKTQLEITVKDDGNGFDMETIETGSGLINMKKRAELINATYKLDSHVEQGTKLILGYAFRGV